MSFITKKKYMILKNFTAANLTDFFGTEEILLWFGTL